MDALSTVDSTSFIVSAIAVIVYFALRQIASRMGDDMYSLFKRLIRWLFGRSNRVNKQAMIATAEGTESTVTTTASDVDAAKPEPLFSSRSTRKKAQADAKPILSTNRGDYFTFAFLTTGDMAKLYRADFRERVNRRQRPVVVKIAREAAAASAMQQEATILRELQRDSGAHGKHLPRIIEQFRTAEGNAGTVFETLEGHTLQQLRTRFAEGIEPRHVLWMFRRSLSILGYVHNRGILHGNLRPGHLFIRPRDHNVWLLDWTCAIQRPNETGQGFQAKDPIYAPPEAHRGQAPIPASDLYALGKVMVYAFGGDPVRETIPQTVPEPLVRFTRFFLKESPVQRPQDAWEMYRALEKIRDALYGPHRFVEFVVD